MALGKIDSVLGIKRSGRKQSLGIYISLTDIYVAQVFEKSGGIEVDSLIKLPVGEVNPTLLKPSELNEGFFSSPKHWLDPIKKIIDSRHWKTKDVVISLSPSFSIHRHFVMQDMSRHHWRQAVPLQARKYIHYQFDRGVYDYAVYPFYAPLSKAKRLGVAFSITSSRIVAVLEAGMRNIGLNLVAVETSPLSIYRLFNQTDKENIPGKGCIYANFTQHDAQFLFALNDVPILLREVEASRAAGARNRLEVNNCVDFVSKQLEKNPFEDITIVSDDGDFWAPILEGEVKRHVRIWKISEIFGFKVTGFEEMAAIGACLKFLNDKVGDIDLYRKNRSSDEEIRGTMTVWKLALLILAGFLVWGSLVQTRAFLTYVDLKRQDFTSKESIPDFKGLYADQIKAKVEKTSKDAKTLASLLSTIKYTPKLNTLPDLMPADMWLTSMSIRYPYTLRDTRERNSMRFDGIVSVYSGREDELALGAQFKNAVEGANEMNDICRPDSIKIGYDFNDTPLMSRRKNYILGTKFVLSCERDKK